MAVTRIGQLASEMRLSTGGQPVGGDFPESRKKSEENCTKIWNKWRKVVNLRLKSGEKLQNRAVIACEKLQNRPFGYRIT